MDTKSHAAMLKLFEKSTKSMNEVSRTVRALTKEIQGLRQESKAMFEITQLDRQAQSEQMKGVIKTTECVDETLVNVLLAIRQNEYLQAYYPAQHGYPEMKVTGKHPAKYKQEKSA